MAKKIFNSFLFEINQQQVEKDFSSLTTYPHNKVPYIDEVMRVGLTNKDLHES